LLLFFRKEGLSDRHHIPREAPEILRAAAVEDKAVDCAFNKPAFARIGRQIRMIQESLS
jgi:hypothetical protein